MAAISLLANHHFGEGNLAASETCAKEGLQIAVGCSATAERAYFLAIISSVHGFQSSQMDLDGVHKSKLYMSTGIRMETEFERDRKTKEGKELRNKSYSEMDKALRLALESHNIEAVYEILNLYAWNESYIGYPYSVLGATDHVEYSLKMIRSAFERLISISPTLGTSYLGKGLLSMGSILANYGKEDEARSLAKQALLIARRDEYEDLARMAESMLHKTKGI